MTIQLADGWESLASRETPDGLLVLAGRTIPVDLTPRKRNMFDQYTTFVVGPDATVPGDVHWDDRAAAERDFAADR